MKIPVELVAVVVSAMGTYIITKRNTLSETKRLILTSQIDNIFVPLSKFFKYKDRHSQISVADAKDLNTLLSHIIADNYKYITTDLFELANELQVHLNENNYDRIKCIYNEINIYVSNTFEALKHTLSLPTSSIKTRWSLMKQKDKVTYILETFVLPIFFLALIAYFIGFVTYLISTRLFHNTIGSETFSSIAISSISLAALIMSVLYSLNK